VEHSRSRISIQHHNLWGLSSSVDALRIRKLCDGVGATWSQPHTNLGQLPFQVLDESGYGQPLGASPPSQP
jgi:hypothetical protein